MAMTAVCLYVNEKHLDSEIVRTIKSVCTANEIFQSLWYEYFTWTSLSTSLYSPFLAMIFLPTCYIRCCSGWYAPMGAQQSSNALSVRHLNRGSNTEFRSQRSKMWMLGCLGVLMFVSKAELSGRVTLWERKILHFLQCIHTLPQHFRVFYSTNERRENNLKKVPKWFQCGRWTRRTKVRWKLETRRCWNSSTTMYVDLGGI